MKGRFFLYGPDFLFASVVNYCNVCIIDSLMLVLTPFSSLVSGKLLAHVHDYARVAVSSLLLSSTYFEMGNGGLVVRQNKFLFLSLLPSIPPSPLSRSFRPPSPPLPPPSLPEVLENDVIIVSLTLRFL